MIMPKIGIEPFLRKSILHLPRMMPWTTSRSKAFEKLSKSLETWKKWWKERDQRAVFIPGDGRWVCDSLPFNHVDPGYMVPVATYLRSTLLPSPKWIIHASKAAALLFIGANEALCMSTRHQRENLTQEHHIAASTLDELSKDLH